MPHVGRKLTDAPGGSAGPDVPCFPRSTDAITDSHENFHDHDEETLSYYRCRHYTSCSQRTFLRVPTLPGQPSSRTDSADPPPANKDQLNCIKRRLAKLEPSEEEQFASAGRTQIPVQEVVSSDRDLESVLVGLPEAGLRDRSRVGRRRRIFLPSEDCPYYLERKRGSRRKLWQGIPPLRVSVTRRAVLVCMSARLSGSFTPVLTLP